MWQTLRDLMTRGGGWAAAMIAGLVVVHVWVTRYVISRDRADLERDFSEARLEQIVDATEGVEDNVEEVADDLEFARGLLAEDDGIDEREARLESLLSGVESYRAAVVVDQEGRRVIDLQRESGGQVDPSIDRRARRLAEGVIDQGDDAVHVSRSLNVGSDEQEETFRIFATAVEPQVGDERGAVAVVVDTASLFSPLELAATDDHSRLLMMSGDGTVEAPTDEALAGDEQLAPVAPLVAQMAERDKGTVRLSGDSARRLDLGTHDLIGAHADVRVGERTRWRVASVTSLSALQKRERNMMLRLGGLSAAVGLLLLGFGTYMVVSVRRQTALSERLRAARKVALLNEKADKVLESIPTAVMVLSEDRRVTGVNRAFETRLDRPHSGRTIRELFDDADDEQVDALAELVERSKADQDVEVVVDEQCSLFGEEGQYRIQAVPLEPADPDERVLVVFEDFSELHALERQLLQAEKLSTVGILAAGIAHEVGTPLGVIRGRAEYLQYKLDEDDPSRESLQIIIDQIDRVSRVIRGLLDFSREEAPTVSAVDVAGVVERVVDLLHYEIERKEVELEVDLEEGLPRLAADADELEQVLVNLVVNACDASSPGDQIRVAASPVDDADDEPSTRLRLIVEDTGKGIPEERIHQVFDPFFTTKKRGKGTGLGLPIVAKIVRNHGGKIDLDSEPGEGTRFILEWPTVAAKKPPEKETNDATDQRQRAHSGGG